MSKYYLESGWPFRNDKPSPGLTEAAADADTSPEMRTLRNNRHRHRHCADAIVIVFVVVVVVVVVGVVVVVVVAVVVVVVVLVCVVECYCFLIFTMVGMPRGAPLQTLHVFILILMFVTRFIKKHVPANRALCCVVVGCSFYPP